MATVLYATTFGSDDPTRATLAFVAAAGAVDAGHKAQIALLGEATFLAKDSIVENVHGVGFAPLKEVLAKIVEHKVPIFV